MKSFPEGFGSLRASRAFAFVLAMVCALIVTACSFTTPRTRYFILTAAAAPAAANASSLRVGLEPLKPSALYGQQRIAYRGAAHEIGFYYYQQWAVPPNQLVGDAVLDALRDSKRFADVENAPTRDALDVVASGELVEMYEDDRGPTAEAVLSINWTIRDGATDQPLKRMSTAERVPVESPTPEGLADAMSRAVVSTAMRLAGALEDASARRQSKEGME